MSYKEQLKECIWMSKDIENDVEVITYDEALDTCNFAYKEGYLEAKADILEILRQEEGILMISAIVAIRQMKLPKFE